MKSELKLPWKVRLLAACAIGVAVWVLRVALVGDLGTGIPWMDQWDCEGLNIYRPWIEGSLTWRVIFAPWLEHRIVWTHLWNLSLFELCGQWDPMVQMFIQAVIPALTAGCCVWGLLAVSGAWVWRSAVLVGATIAFGGPFAHENILWGFQSQFGFFVALSLLGCAATGLAWSNRRYVWLVLFAGLAAPLAMGAGALAGPIIIATGILVALAERKFIGRTCAVLGVGLICLIWGLSLRSTSTGTLYAYAKSVAQFVQAWLAACAWPNSETPWLAGLACLPVILLIIKIVRKGTLPQPHELFIVGVVVWAIGCAAGGAWARGGLGAIPPSRYGDFLTLLCWANLLALVSVVSAWGKRGGAYLMVWGIVIAVAWVGSVGYGGTRLLQDFFKTERPARQMSAALQLAQLNEVVEENTFVIKNKAKLERQPKPHELVFASPVLAPYLPPELQMPCKGITLEGILMISPADIDRPWQWESGQFKSPMSALIVYVYGDARQLKLGLWNQVSERKEWFRPSGRRIGDWSEWLVRVIPGRYQLSIETAPVPEGLGVILPRPLSAAGYWARRIAAEGTILIMMAGICLILALIVSCPRIAKTDEVVSTAG